MELKLKDLLFEVQSATISCTLPDPYWIGRYNKGGNPAPFWSVHVNTHERVLFDSDRWEPYVYHESLFFDIRRWMELEGQCSEWETCDDCGEANGGFYVYHHGDIHQGSLKFLKRAECEFHIHWSGSCEISWNDEYGDYVPFSIDTMATFTEVRVRGSEIDTTETLKLRLSQYLNTDDFTQEPIQFGSTYEDGKRMAHSVFRPRSDV